MTANSDISRGFRARMSGARMSGDRLSGDRLSGDRAWRTVLAGGLAVLTAASVTAFVRGTDPAGFDTRLAAVRTAVVVGPDGVEHAAHDGDLVAPGSTLRTGADGAASLVTAGRTVYVGALSTVAVRDGVRQELSKGQVLVDTRRGPRLDLTTLAGLVRTPKEALARVEHGASLRVALLAGDARFTAAGRQATASIPRYYQVRVPYGAVAGRPTALALTPGDRWERMLAAGLVQADTDLNRFAMALDGPDGVAVLASLRTGPALAQASGEPRSEQALAAALAEAAGKADSLERVTAARREGGSWGVVAAIVGARVTTVSALLDQVLGLDPVGFGDPVTAGAVPDLGGLLGGGGGPGATPGPDGVSVTPTPGATSRPTASPTPTRPPIVDPTPTPGVVEDLLTTVLSLLPSPLPTLLPSLAVSPSAPPLLPVPAVKPPAVQLPLVGPSPTPLLGVDLGLG